MVQPILLSSIRVALRLYSPFLKGLSLIDNWVSDMDIMSHRKNAGVRLHRPAKIMGSVRSRQPSNSSAPTWLWLSIYLLQSACWDQQRFICLRILKCDWGFLLLIMLVHPREIWGRMFLRHLRHHPNAIKQHDQYLHTCGVKLKSTHISCRLSIVHM